MSSAGKAHETGSCFPKGSPMKRIFSSKKSATTISPHKRLDDKVAVITGAASGIGAATARLFVSHGAKVIIADLNAEAGKKLSSELGTSAHFFPCDVTNEDSVAAAVNYAVSSWGHLDIMFNNAGVSGPLNDLTDINIEEFDQVMAVHIKGAVLGVKHAARVMIPAGKGVILCSGSTSAVMGGAGPPLHSAANAAVLCIVRSAAAELVRHGIRVNAVSPHCVATPLSIVTFGKSTNSKPDISIEQFEKLLAVSSKLDVLTVEKVANAVMFLASDEAGFISGHNLVLDGGFSVTKQFGSSNLNAPLQNSRVAALKAEAASKTVEAISPVRPLQENRSNKGSKESIAKEPETEDKARDKEESRERENEEKAAQKALAEKEKVTQKEEKDREKREKETKNEEEKARVKQEKDLAKDEKARAKEEKAGLAKEGQAQAKDAGAKTKDPVRPNGEIHPLDQKALAKEERIRNENIELPNAGPEPDVPMEFQERPPVKTIGSLLSWGKTASNKDKTEDKTKDSGLISQVDKKGKSYSKPAKDSSKEIQEDKPTNAGQDSKKKKKEDKGTDPGKDLKKESKNKHKAIDPGKDSKKEKNKDKSTDTDKYAKKEKNLEDKAVDPGTSTQKEKKKDKLSKKEASAERARTEDMDSPKAAAPSRISPEPEPKKSQLEKIGSFLRRGVNPTKRKDESTNPGNVSGKEAESKDSK